MKKILFIASIFLLGATSDIVYVMSLKAKIMKEPTLKSSVVFNIAKGAKLKVIEKNKKWLKVISSKNRTGWIPVLLVSHRPPAKRVTVFTGKESDISNDARRRSSSIVGSAAAARGLTDTDRERLGQKATSNYLALKEVESIKITDQELIKFLETSE